MSRASQGPVRSSGEESFGNSKDLARYTPLPPLEGERPSGRVVIVL